MVLGKSNATPWPILQAETCQIFSWAESPSKIARVRQHFWGYSSAKIWKQVPQLFTWLDKMRQILESWLQSRFFYSCLMAQNLCILKSQFHISLMMMRKWGHCLYKIEACFNFSISHIKWKASLINITEISLDFWISSTSCLPYQLFHCYDSLSSVCSVTECGSAHGSR